MDAPASRRTRRRPPPPGPHRRRPWVGALLTVLASTAVLWLVSAAGLAVYTADTRDPETRVLDIPAGTAALVEAGANPLEIPASWGFLADDTLRLVNHDDANHWLGPFYVPAHETSEYVLRASYSGSILCSLHPAREITIDVQPRRFDWRATVLPTLVLGPTVGVVLAAVARIVANLDDGGTGADRAADPAGTDPTSTPWQGAHP